MDIRKRRLEFEDYAAFREYRVKKKSEREELVTKELEKAKNDFYSGNGEESSNKDNAKIEENESMSNVGDSENEADLSEEGNILSEEKNEPEELGDFNEEAWLKKWSEQFPEVVIPEQKEMDVDADLEPGFDLEKFQAHMI